MVEAAGSRGTFPDGRAWRLEIPSTEGPAVLDAVLAEADARGVAIDRISQGSGIQLLLDAEIEEMQRRCADRGIELSLFVGPRGSFDVGASVLAAGGGALRGALRGRRQLDQAHEDVLRAVELGVRSVLVADIGLLAVLGRARASAELPADFVIKVSVLGAPANPAAMGVVGELGADSINVHSDHSLAELAELRAATEAAIDFYVEAPDDIGGFIRYHEIAELVRVAAPIYLKFGLRNAPGIYPSGLHLEPVAIASARERVRRAEVGLEHLARLEAKARA